LAAVEVAVEQIGLGGFRYVDSAEEDLASGAGALFGRWRLFAAHVGAVTATARPSVNDKTPILEIPLKSGRIALNSLLPWKSGDHLSPGSCKQR